MSDLLQCRLATPVAFIVFNRPQSAARVFAEIARARPPKLLVVADGPRADRPGEAELCRLARSVIDRVDWPCEVLTHYSDVSLGCRNRVASGIDWVFAQVPEAIILEDDCVPSPAFFRFCQDNLERYRDDGSVLHISGTAPNWARGPARTFLSKFPRIWGWATWARAWKKYDRNPSPGKIAEAELAFEQIAGGRDFAAECFLASLRDVVAGRVDTWDYQWLLAVLTNGYALNTAQNMVLNVGFSAEATHTAAGMPPLTPVEYGRRMESAFAESAGAQVYDRRIDAQWLKSLSRSTYKTFVKSIVFRSFSLAPGALVPQALVRKTMNMRFPLF